MFDLKTNLDMMAGRRPDRHLVPVDVDIIESDILKYKDALGLVDAGIELL